MTASTHNPEIQLRENGPLTDQFRQRVLDVKAKLDLNFGDIATRVGIAGSTLGNIVRYDTHNTSTTTANRIANVIGELETLEAIGGDAGDLRKPEKLTITEAKNGLAATYGVSPEAIEIIIRG